MEKVFFENSKGQKLCGVLDKVSSDKEIVIVVHGYGSCKEGKTSLDVAKELNARGINAFRIDLDGCGDSGGDFAEQTVTNMADDIVFAIKYVESLGYNNIDLLGASGGAISSMVAVLAYPHIRKLALKSPVSDYVEQRIDHWGAERIKEWKNKGFVLMQKSRGEMRANYSFFEDAQNHMMYDKVKDITCPTLIVHGDADSMVTINQSKKVIKNFPNGRLIILKGANHDLGINGDRSLSNRIFTDWLEGKEITFTEEMELYEG
jgi:uncharacterized protein